MGESEFKAILSVPGFPKFSGSLQNLQQLLNVVVCNCIMEWDKKWLSHWSVWRHLYTYISLELPSLQQILNSMFLLNYAYIVYSFPLQNITEYRKCWTNCFNLFRSLRKLPFPITFSPSVKPPLNPEHSTLVSLWIKVTNGFCESSYCFPSPKVIHFHLPNTSFFIRVYSIWARHKYPKWISKFI